jgi:hypothetical protein
MQCGYETVMIPDQVTRECWIVPGVGQERTYSLNTELGVKRPFNVVVRRSHLHSATIPVELVKESVSCAISVAFVADRRKSETSMTSDAGPKSDSIVCARPAFISWLNQSKVTCRFIIHGNVMLVCRVFFYSNSTIAIIIDIHTEGK